MPPFLQFVIRRFLVIPISLLIITLILYGGMMLTLPEASVPPPPVPEIVLQTIRSNGEQAVSSKPNQTVSVDGAGPILQTARESVSQGDLPRALHAYKHLIQRNRLVADLLPDLAHLVKKYPQDPQIWETLGDALARAGNADHANQSYERARKLTQQNSA